jgi:hypothetical protein
MAVNYRASLKTTRMTAVRDDIDSGAGAGILEICTAGYASVLATFTCNDPCGTVSGDTLSFSGLTKSATAGNSGTAAVARFRNSSNVDIVTGLTVGTSGTDIVISPSTTITSGQTVEWTAGTITHSA